MAEEKHIVAIDLGTSTIALAVATVNGNDTQVVFYKEAPSAGIKYSGVQNTLMACAPLESLVKEAEDALGIKITQAVVGMPKFPVRQETNNGRIDDRGEDTEITAEDIENLKRFAQENYPLEDDSKEAIYGAVAQSFSVDDTFQVREDEIVGMASNMLEGNFKIFIGRRKDLRNIDTLLNKANLSARKKYFTAETTAKVVLTETEMENGVALIDLGAGSTSVTIYHEGIMRHYASIPFGGKNVTKDIEREVLITERLAENIKLAFGACMPDRLLNMSEKVLHIIGSGNDSDKQLSVKYLSEIITARLEEILQAILYEIQESGLADKLRSGIVVTGGCAQTANLGMLIGEMSGYRVRTGYPDARISEQGVDGIHETSAATVMGLVKAALEEEAMNCAITVDDERIAAAITEEEPAEVIEAVTEKKVEQEAEPEVEQEVETDVEQRIEEFEEAEDSTEGAPEEKPEKKKWKLGEVLWGQAKKIGNRFNSFIDGITGSDEDEDEDEYEDEDRDDE